MGKKGRKTRWRTLTIADEHSDSEESNTTTSGHRVPKGYPHKSYYGRFTYSSQSTPTRRYQCDGAKSTRSSSTASENKITFNEDEYTRITTPRQDVLFKKGYLNKPKTYQTQTSTGNSTTSTGNSTGNGTPDHQSTDLEYESQFVFPNGFVDQNGICYVNSFEPYPVMLFNPPTYYPDYTAYKTKRCSTGSLTESTSPNNEEAEASQSETPSNVPGSSEPRRVKKRRRRKSSPDRESSSDEEEEQPEEEEEEEGEETKAKYDLKPDAEEFVPRAYRHPEAAIPMEANVHFIKFPPNFVPLPILNPIEFNAFMGYPINFVPPNYVNFVPYKTPSQIDEEEKEEVKETVEVPKTNPIDIEKIVSKLEEAAKEQEDETTAVKEESQSKSKKHRYQKMAPPSPEKKQVVNSPKKEESAQKVVRNYSDTLKKAVAAKGCERHERHMKVNREVAKEAPRRMEKTLPKVTNEWISVSSRKKRKNRNIEESEDFEEPVEESIAPPPATEETKKTEEVVVIVEPEPEPPKPEPVETKTEEVKEEKKAKKKTKKNHVKAPPPPLTKRVMIKDIDLSMDEKVEEEIEVKKDEPVIVEAPVEVKVIEEVVQVEKKESPEKKTKKKKKKVTKNVIVSSDTTLNVADDSYDFLLDESLDKTNVEVSQELDKMIQRGIYSNLEEKIKSMNIEPSDSFFKTIISNISSRESSVEKSNPYMKSPDLSKLLTRPGPRAQPGDFLGESATPAVAANGGGDDDNLYPITKAVKEWMTKTRETTPEVEIFKSPSAILLEFGEELEEEGSEDSGDGQRKTSVSSIEEGEDVLENEEYLTKSYPKHGNLPYRAICCSIM